MNKILLTLSFLLIQFTSNGQASDATIEKDYIEVTGDAEMQVTPDEIYIQITILERYEGRDKITLDSIEHLLKDKLVELGIQLKNLSLSDASSDLVKVRWSRKDNLSSKEYILKVYTASEVSKVFEELAKIKIQELSINRVDHSQIEEFNKEVKTNAIKAAKNKATYLLAAIGSQIGKPICITENTNYNNISAVSGISAGLFNVRGSRGGDTPYYVDGIKTRGSSLADEVSYQKIILQYKITARFEIK